MQACADEFLAMVTEGIVHGVYKIVTRSSFGVTWHHKASVGIGISSLCHNFTYEPHMVVEGKGRVAQHL